MKELPVLDSALMYENKILTDVLNQARETLLISIKGTPEALQRSLGKLNLACKVHWDWQTKRIPGDEAEQPAPLTRQQIEQAREMLNYMVRTGKLIERSEGEVDALCNMALASL